MFFDEYLQLKKEKPLIEEMFARCDLWSDKICKFVNQKQYYDRIYKPTMELLNYMDELEFRCKASSSLNTIRTMRRNSLQHFEKITRIIFKDIPVLK